MWAAGDSWHYAPLAASLARLGVITCVMQYTLYPDALVPQLVQEVSAAFDWALDNVAAYGGDANKVRATHQLLANTALQLIIAMLSWLTGFCLA